MNILVLGGYSSIAEATCKKFLAESTEQQVSFDLVGRNQQALSIVSQDLVSRGALSVETIEQDFTDLESTSLLMEKLTITEKQYDVTIIAHGVLPDQSDIESDLPGILKGINVNALSYIIALFYIERQLAKQNSGTIIVLSSVAGDRGRASNYVYGAAKGMVSLYTQGVRNKVSKSGIHLMTVKPGFVKSNMTSHLDTDGLLWATPDKIASDIYNGFLKKKDVIYTPWFWRYIMMIIKLIPERIFKNLSI